jgi:hypothetical protein
MEKNMTVSENLLQSAPENFAGFPQLTAIIVVTFGKN